MEVGQHLVRITASKGVRLSLTSWHTVKLLTEQSEAETETKTVQLWKELWL